MRPDSLLTREEYRHWRKENTNLDECLFCDPASQFVIKEYPSWLWVYSTAPYRPFNTMFIPRRHIETIQEITVPEFVEFQAVHEESRHTLRRLGHGRALMFWRQRDDKIHKGTGAPNALHLHVQMMPDTEDMMNSFVIDGANNVRLYERLVEAANER